jgi:acrylyl-CoA reductase (NADPH)
MTFHAFVAREKDNSYDIRLEELQDADLPQSGVTVDVAWSSVNYKDALAMTARGRIFRRLPMVPGIDLAGVVTASDSPEFNSGDQVLAVGQGLGESDWGGYAERQRVRPDALVRLPQGMTLEQSMQIGTAGFTAMLCVMALERNNVRPDDREVLVTGAAGGVGSIAVMLLARLGYRVAASTGRPELADFLRGLGAATVVSRDELSAAGAAMQKERWAGGIDTVGGTTLANAFAQTAYEGAIACCGMAGGHELTTTVWPLILRNVSLLGVSSIRTPRATREEAWWRLSRDVDFVKLAELSHSEPLARVPEVAEELLAGKVRGRTVVKVGAD